MTRAYNITFKPHRRTSLKVDKIPANVVFANNKASAKELGEAIVRDYYEREYGYKDDYMTKQYTYIIEAEGEKTMTRTQNTKHETTYTKDLTARFYPSYGNEKTGGKDAGMMAIGYMPGAGILEYKDGTPVTDCPGTCSAVDCSACVKQCYAVSMVKRYKDARIHRIENTLQLRENITQHFDDIRAAILRDKIRMVRYTDSGEIETGLQFLKLVNLAAGLPSVRFYLYTKNYTVLREFFGSGKELPTNLVCLISIWEDLGEKEFAEFRNHRNIKAFAVKPATIKPQVMCPAYKKDPKTGRVKLNAEMTCAKCGLCIGTRGNADIIGCLEH